MEVSEISFDYVEFSASDTYVEISVSNGYGCLGSTGVVCVDKMYLMAWGQMVVEAMGIGECWGFFFFILKSEFLKVMCHLP